LFTQDELKTMSESQTSPRRIKAAERTTQALALRRGGLTYEVIAKQLGFRSAQAAWAAVARALKDAKVEAVAQYRAMELQRLDALTAAMWPHAMKGIIGAVRECRKLSERRARLLGLDQPMRADVNVSGEVNYVGPRERLAAKLAEMSEALRTPLPSGVLGDNGALRPFEPPKQLTEGQRDDRTGETGDVGIILPNEAIVRRR
jgi:hypothetical protein